MTEHQICICDGQHRTQAIDREILDKHQEVVGGLPVILIRAVEVSRCKQCGEVLSKKIPDLQNLIAAMAVTRVTDPLKLRSEDIRFLRKTMNWTGKELASALGVSVETVSRWENGKDLIGIANEKLLRLIVGTTMTKSAPAIDFEPDQIAKMRIESVRAADEIGAMCFERIRFKRPSHPKENQWDTGCALEIRAGRL